MKATKAWVVKVYVDMGMKEKTLMLYLAAFDTAEDAVNAVRKVRPATDDVSDGPEPADEALAARMILRTGEVRPL